MGMGKGAVSYWVSFNAADHTASSLWPHFLEVSNASYL